MNFTKFDFTILVSMSILIIFMSFTFPAMGLTAENVTSDSIPQFNITQDKFSFSGDFPEQPGFPSKGIINHSSNQFDQYRGSIQVELGNDGNGNGSVFLAAGNADQVTLSNSTSQVSKTYTSNDVTKEFIIDSYTVEVHSNNITYGEYEYLVTKRPSDEGFIESIPVIGGIFSASQQIASGLVWIGSVILYVIIFFVEFILNLITISLEVIFYFLSQLYWLVSTYLTTVNAAPSGYISVIILLPGIALFIEFAKIIMVIVDLLWIG